MVVIFVFFCFCFFLFLFCFIVKSNRTVRLRSILGHIASHEKHAVYPASDAGTPPGTGDGPFPPPMEEFEQNMRAFFYY